MLYSYGLHTCQNHMWNPYKILPCQNPLLNFYELRPCQNHVKFRWIISLSRSHVKSLRVASLSKLFNYSLWLAKGTAIHHLIKIIMGLYDSNSSGQPAALINFFKNLMLNFLSRLIQLYGVRLIYIKSSKRHFPNVRKKNWLTLTPLNLHSSL